VIVLDMKGQLLIGEGTITQLIKVLEIYEDEEEAVNGF
jgi:hypothetical protein